jgi:acetyltransferase-like isoleucine patch superfamily enzyme
MAYLRRRHRLHHVHPTFYLAGSAQIASDFRAGPHSFVNRDCLIGPQVEIGAYTMFGPQVSVVGDDHIFDRPGVPIVFAGRPRQRPTKIGDDVWVGFGAVIMSGSTIGNGAIVAARSVVTHDVGPYEIVAGAPARKIGERFPDPSERSRHEEMLSGPPQAGERAAVKQSGTDAHLG